MYTKQQKLKLIEELSGILQLGPSLAPEEINQLAGSVEIPQDKKNVSLDKAISQAKKARYPQE